MKPAHLALLTAALPFLCVHLNYLLGSVAAGFLRLYVAARCKPAAEDHCRAGPGRP